MREYSGFRRSILKNLKRKVVEPWFSELERIGSAKRGDPPLPVISSTADLELTYKGDKLEVENDVLFDDLRNHINPIIFQTYEKFKESCKELSKKYEDFKRNLEKYLSTELWILDWNEFYQSEKHPGFFEKGYMLNFFLDSLLSGCECEIEFVNSLKELHRNSEKLYGLLFSSKFVDKQPYIGKYRSEYGEYIDREIDEGKRDEIKAIIEDLLKRFQKEFKEEINEIHGLIEEINKSRERTIKELRKLREKTIFSGKCEFIGTEW